MRVNFLSEILPRETETGVCLRDWTTPSAKVNTLGKIMSFYRERFVEKYIMEQFGDSGKFLGKWCRLLELLPKRLKLTSQITKQIIVRDLCKATGWLSSSTDEVMALA